MRLSGLVLTLVAITACGKPPTAGRAACGLAALAGPTALLTQFGVPRQTLSRAPAQLPERLVARVVAGPALVALVGRADTLLVIGVEGAIPPAIKPGYGVLVLDQSEKARGVMLFEGLPVEGAPADRHGNCRLRDVAADRHSARPGEDRRSALSVLPGFGVVVSAPLIAVGGVNRTWDGSDRTGVNAAYAKSVLAAGGVPLILSPLLGTSHAARALAGVDGVLFTGGEDLHPAWYHAEPSPHLFPPSRERDLFELALFAAARQLELPILGICRGIQLINVAMGGTLYQDIPAEYPTAIDHNPTAERHHRTHAVRLEPGSRAESALGSARLAVNSFHHQAIRDAGQGTGRDRLDGGRFDRGGRDGPGNAVAVGGAVAS